MYVKLPGFHFLNNSPSNEGGSICDLLSTMSPTTAYPSPSDAGVLELPGLWLSLQQTPQLPTATRDWFADPISVRERVVIGVISTLKNKKQ